MSTWKGGGTQKPNQRRQPVEKPLVGNTQREYEKQRDDAKVESSHSEEPGKRTRRSSFQTPVSKGYEGVKMDSLSGYSGSLLGTLTVAAVLGVAWCVKNKLKL